MKNPERQANHIVVVEDDQALRSLLEEELTDAGYEATGFTDAESAWLHLRVAPAALIISDVRLPGASGIDLLLQTRQLAEIPGFIIITAFGTVEQAVDALKQGADDFLTKPLKLDHLRLSVERVLETCRLRQEVRRYRKVLAEDGFHGLIGRSESIQKLFDSIRQIAKAIGPVLITGESGTGKELVARAIHRESERKQAPFITVNCAGIPPELLESELFGHAAGAFTGARQSRKGLFAEADGGTLLLDEIGDMPLEMQSKLLRILQDGRVRPVGANRERELDVRIITATNRDLHEEVAKGVFRQDLFYRLETFMLHVPPLRERGDDVELLSADFINHYSLRLQREIRGIRPEALKTLKSYPFPGNVRELSNIIERAVTFCHDGEINTEHLPERLRSASGNSQTRIEDNLLAELPNWETLPSLEQLEQSYIQYVLNRLDGNKRQAADILGIGRRTLYRRLAGDISESH